MLNSAQIIGRLGRAPEVRYTAAGDAFAHLSVATTEHWTDKKTGERREATEWHRVSLFGRLAEIAGQYLSTGSLVYLAGRLRTRKYAGADGTDRYSTEILADTLKMLDRRQDDGRADAASAPSPAPSHQRRAAPAPFDDMDDDIPF